MSQVHNWFQDQHIVSVIGPSGEVDLRDQVTAGSFEAPIGWGNMADIGELIR